MSVKSDCGRCGGGGVVIPDPCTVCYGRGKRKQKLSAEVVVPAGLCLR